MAEEPTQQLIDYCGIAQDDLQILKDQLATVVAFKKKSSPDSGIGGAALSKGLDVLKTIDNLEKIGSKLPKAIDEIKNLCQQVRLLHRSEAGVRTDTPDLTQSGMGKK